MAAREALPRTRYDGGMNDPSTWILQPKIVKLFKREMRRQGVSQREICRRTGIHKNQLGECFSGKRRLGTEHIDLIASALGVEAEVLLIGGRQEIQSTRYPDEEEPTGVLRAILAIFRM